MTDASDPSGAARPPVDSLAGRLKARRTELSLSASELSRRAGVGLTWVRDVEEERSLDPRDGHLSRIAFALRVNIDWLRHGRGPKHLGLLEAAADAPVAAPADQRPATRSGELVMLPVLHADISAGAGVAPAREDAREWWPLPRHWLVTLLRVNPAQADMVFVSGDSMAPTLKDGEVVVVDRSQRDPAAGGVFAVWDGDGLIVKRLQILRAQGAPPVLRLVSDNAAYPPYEAPAALVTVIGRVRGALTVP